MNRPYGGINFMPKSLRTFLDDMRRTYPSEVVSVAKTVNPLTYDVTAIVSTQAVSCRFVRRSLSSAVRLQAIVISM